MKNTASQYGTFDRRVPSEEPVRLAWRDECGMIRCVTGRCIDISNKRVHVKVREHIPLYSRVMLRADGIRIAGPTSVRYLTRYGTEFILVLDLGN
jgi:hypothetical protein